MGIPPNSQANRPVVSVYGSSMAAQGDPAYENALRLGELLARGGADVACGGYGGVMEAVARGATASGGAATGYTVVGWDMRTPNRYLTRESPCSDLYDRLRHLIEDSAALIALGGGIGTLAEVALAWNHLYMELIEPRPLLVVGEDWSRAIATLGELLELDAAHRVHVETCADVAGAVAVLRERGILE